MRCLLSLLALVSLPALAAGFNDTGILFCGDDNTNFVDCAVVAADGATHPRQDARYGRDAAAMAGVLPKVGAGEIAFDFTALNALGQPTTAGSGPTPHPCVRDNLTGLVWEVKTTDGGLRDQRWTFTWFDSVNKYWNLIPSSGTASGGLCKTTGRCDTEKYVADIKASALCGFADWRMPTRQELQGITHLGRINTAIDPTYFPNSPSAIFWSGSPAANNPSYAWSVNFADGIITKSFSNDFNLIRLVRGSP